MHSIPFFIAAFLIGAVLLFSSVQAQPWTHGQGNNFMSSFVPTDAPLSVQHRKDFRLRWQIANLSSVLGPAGIPDADLFESYTVPLTPNLQEPGNDHVYLLTNKFILHCDVNPYHDYPCVRTYLVALNGTTGELVWMTPSNISWSYGGLDTFPYWAAGAQNVYVAVQPGIKNYFLEAYKGSTGKLAWKFELPNYSMYIGGFPRAVLEATSMDAVFVSMPQQVYALSVTTGKKIWETTLPNTTQTGSNYYYASTSFLVESLSLVIVSFTAYELYAGTVAIDMHTGDILWTSPYYTGNTAGQSVSTGFNPPAIDGEKYLYFQGPISFYSSAIAVLDLTNQGKLAQVYALDYNHNFLGSNMIAKPDAAMSCVYGSDTDWANPSYSFNATTGKNVSFFVNGTNDFDASSYFAAFGVQDDVAYAFAAGAMIAFTIPRVPTPSSAASSPQRWEPHRDYKNKKKSSQVEDDIGSASSSAEDIHILWTLPINEPLEPNTLQLLGNGQRYLGNGRVMMIGTNQNDWENQHLKCIQMYF